MNVSTLQAALVRHLRMVAGAKSVLVMGNVTILGSPWEADVISVTNAYFWHEYEIKVTRADFRQDFQKQISGFSKKSMKKHDVYAGSEIVTRWGDVIPRPKSFSFVVPKGLLDGLEVPKHCGMIEVYENDNGDCRLKYKWSAPTLQKPTKLDQKQIFNLAQKAASRVLYHDRSDQ